ncbi:MAG: DNA recombination protein RmuC [Syntrophales bacterium]|nr:DNA recombination protein RmuC [Syntrophales bacterium]
MYLLDWGVLVALVILIALILTLLWRGRTGDVAAKLDASLREQFLAFQFGIHRELNSTREEVVRSKDLISEHTVKTIDTIRDMGATIHRIIQQQEEAHKLDQSLKDILQAPKLRGSYGEAILEEMLERVLPKGIWERQYTIDGREQVDAVVKFKGIVIPIDAKFPRDDYQKYLEAPSPEEKSRHWKGHENAVKTQIRSINSRYIKPDKGTSEFALMFIPSEAIYYETIAEKNYLGEPAKLYEYAQENRVIPVSPNTFYAFLQVIILGVRNIEIIKSVKKLQEGLTSIQYSFEKFYRKYEEIGKHIEKAHDAYRIGNSHIELYKHRLDSTLRLEGFREDIDDLPAGNTTDD